MRNARLLHEDLLAKEGETILQGGWRMALKILNFKRVPPFSLFNLYKEEVKVPGMDRVFL